MFSGKLGPVRKHEERSDRLLNVRNRIADRLEQDIFWKISKEKRIADEKREMYTSQMRKSFVRWRALVQCLEKGKETDAEEHIYGCHGGRPLNSYNTEIDECIDYNQPDKKRRRQLDKMMKRGLQKGTILDEDSALNKMADYFEDQWGVNFPNLRPKNEKDQSHFRREATVGHVNSLPEVSPRGNTFLVTGNKHKYGYENDFTNDSKNDENHAKSRKRKKLDYLTKKVECTKPNCSGYIGNTFVGVLPAIK